MQPTLQHYQVTLTLTNVVTAQVNTPVAAACAAVGAPFRDEALHPKICNYHPFTVKLSGQWAPTLAPDVQQIAYALYAALVSVHGPQVAVDIEVTGIYHAPVARAVHSITTPAPIAVNGGFNMGDRVIIRCTSGWRSSPSLDSRSAVWLPVLAVQAMAVRRSCRHTHETVCPGVDAPANDR